MGNSLDVLLDDEGREGRYRERPGGGKAKTSGKPGERETGDRQDEQDLRSVLEVFVERPRRGAGQPVRDGVSDQNAGRHERRDGEPHSRAVHAPIIRPPFARWVTDP